MSFQNMKKKNISNASKTKATSTPSSRYFVYSPSYSIEANEEEGEGVALLLVASRSLNRQSFLEVLYKKLYTSK